MQNPLDFEFADKLAEVDLIELDILVYLERQVNGRLALWQRITVSIKQGSVLPAIQHHRSPTVVFRLPDEGNATPWPVCHFHVEYLQLVAARTVWPEFHVGQTARA